MKLSLEFFEIKLNQIYPETKAHYISSNPPRLSAMGILGNIVETNDAVLYVDILDTVQSSRIAQQPVSVITLQKRMKQFPHSNVIALPDDTDLTEASHVISAIFTRYLSWADDIYEAINANMPVERLIELSAPIFNRPIYFADASFQMLASWDTGFAEQNEIWRHQLVHRYLPPATLSTLRDTGEMDRITSTDKAQLIIGSDAFRPGRGYISKAIRRNGVYCGGFFVINQFDDITGCELELADTLGNIVANATYSNTNYLETRKNYHHMFIGDMISGELIDIKAISDQLSAIGWGPNGDFMLVEYDTLTDETILHSLITSTMASSFNAQCLVHKGRTLVVLNHYFDRREQLRKAIVSLANTTRCIAATCECFHSFYDLPEHFQQTEFVLNSYHRVGIGAMGNNRDRQEGRVFYYGNLFIDHLHDMTNDTLPSYGPVERLRFHDGSKGSDYCRTLYIWLLCCRNTTEAAKRLYIHRNTLTNRLEKIERIIQVPLDDFQQQIRLLLALKDLFPYSFEFIYNDWTTEPHKDIAHTTTRTKTHTTRHTTTHTT